MLPEVRYRVHVGRFVGVCTLELVKVHCTFREGSKWVYHYFFGFLLLNFLRLFFFGLCRLLLCLFLLLFLVITTTMKFFVLFSIKLCHFFRKASHHQELFSLVAG